MNESQGERLDSAIAAALQRNIARDAEAFLALDVSDVKDCPEFKERILAIADGRESRHSRRINWRTVLLAAALALSLLLTACVCIPQVRAAIRDIILQWREDHVCVLFEPQLQSAEFTPSNDENAVLLTYMPQKYVRVERQTGRTFNFIEFSDGNGTHIFTFMQTAADRGGNHLLVNSEAFDIRSASVGEFEGVLGVSTEGPSRYYLVWQDGEYQYWLIGSFESEEELIKIAEGVVIQ